jgi:hypothetical protein
MKTYAVVPLTLKDANAVVSAFHRHHSPVITHRFSIGAVFESRLVGCAIVGRPASRLSDQNYTAEIARLATDGSRNACSVLLGACARAARAMGFARIQTFTLDSETGASLRGAGWVDEGLRKGKKWTQRFDGRTRHNEHPLSAKRRWALVLAPAPPDGFDLDLEVGLL